ncbi:MAG TPA: hypothetical protein VMB80_11180 [Candidatus Acidoferrum sp.]|nr:hypothetical protein [Candidatus Acidoferrum sp.]
MPEFLRGAFNRRRERRWWICLPLLFIFATGCHRDDVKVYQTGKETDQPQAQAAPAQPTDSPTPTLPPGHPDISSLPGLAAGGMAAPGPTPLTWKTPDGWTQLAPGQMRVGSFKVTGPGGKTADVSIIPLGGTAGGDVANVNRWRAQIGLDPVPAEEIKQSAQTVEVAGQPAELYALSGKNPGTGEPAGILAAIAQRGETAWFFKMTGDPGLIAEQKPVFVEFLKSIQFGTGESAALPPGQPSMTGMDLPSGHPGVSSPATPGITAAVPPVAGKPDWQVPAGWQETAGGQFLVAKFNITGAGGAAAAVNVSSSAGEGGGLAGNVNRWRGQLGLASWSESDVNQSVTTLDVPGGKASLVDLTGTDPRTSQPTRLVGIVVPQAGQTWFYKLMGNAQVVEDQKAAFIQFVQGVKY